MKKLPKDIDDYIQAASHNIDQNGDLSALFRKKLHTEIEKISAIEHPKAGYFRRVKLAIASALYTLNIWESNFSGEAGPRNIISRSIDCLLNNGDMKSLENDNKSLYIHLIDLSNDNEDLQIASSAGFACCAAANTVLYDIDFDDIEKDLSELDPADWDVSVLSAMAYAGGGVWIEESDSGLRREFWRWYVQKALPGIWEHDVKPGFLPT